MRSRQPDNGIPVTRAHPSGRAHDGMPKIGDRLDLQIQWTHGEQAVVWARLWDKIFRDVLSDGASTGISKPPAEQDVLPSRQKVSRRGSDDHRARAVRPIDKGMTNTASDPSQSPGEVDDER
jgi:hypothetical protein